VAKEFILDPSDINEESRLTHLRTHEPIGCRDQHTMNLLQAQNIKVYYSGCLTLTLLYSAGQRIQLPSSQNPILVVDAHITERELFRDLVPEHIREKAMYLSHALIKLLPQNQKYEEAQRLLLQYQQAHYVITSRLHCALPCLAFGTPVLFLYGKMNTDPRFDDTLHELLGTGNSLPENWSWERPFISPTIRAIVEKIASAHRENIYSIIKS
jgi:exopolysaccharide biosynthesis predicted pyruvyltransferase EpsI